MFTAAKDEMESLIKADMFTAEKPASSVTPTESGVAATLYADDVEDEEEEEEE
jgi:hypothetical protein